MIFMSAPERIPDGEYNVTETAKPRRSSVLPYLVGAGVAVLMLSAGFWQLERAAEKRSEREAFAAEGAHQRFAEGDVVRPYQPLELRGTWLEGRDILLDNIIVRSRVGHYVLTPLVTGSGDPLVLVNRGFIVTEGEGTAAEALTPETSVRSVRGRAGRLPRAGYRMGDAILDPATWPLRALYPEYADIEAALGASVQPFVLLLDADEPNGFERDWQPTGMTPARHTGYAIQWFLMALVLTGLMVWHARKRSFDD